MKRGELSGDGEQRLRFAFQFVRMLAERENPAVIQSGLANLNPELGDRVPLRLMRENDLETRSQRAPWPCWQGSSGMAGFAITVVSSMPERDR